MNGATEPVNRDQFNYRLDVEYDGTHFSGWQIQPGERTVQACFEAAVERLFHAPLSVMAAGRTDAGVHAEGQVAHFRAGLYRPPETVCRALNAMLPDDVRVKTVSMAAPDFHARYSANWRAYRYRIAREPVALGRAYCWYCSHRLNLDAMQAAAAHVRGNHCFRSFAHTSEKEMHYLSSVYRADWIARGEFLDFHIEANRFLHGMVRLLVGTFVSIGRGKYTPDRMPEIIEALDIRHSGPKAPAGGLTLMAVGYEPWADCRRLWVQDTETVC
jgi:tRNA pseudouridine38-40 synthase